MWNQLENFPTPFIRLAVYAVESSIQAGSMSDSDMSELPETV